MKYLIVICLTAIAIALLFDLTQILREDMRQTARMRVEQYRFYTHRQAAPAAPQKTEPSVECPSTPKLQKQKL